MSSFSASTRSPDVSHHKLKRLRVHGGFLDRLDLHFTDGLNCIIGGRGSGKTTVLELVRFGLDRLPRPTTPAGKAAEERIRALISANLGPGGRVELEFESQEGLTYQIRRGAHDPPTITDARGKPVDPAVLGSTILIDAAIFSHNQIEEIASNPAAQRELIDRLCAQALHTLGAKITQAQGALRESAQRLLQLDARLVAARQDLVDLSSWESKLAAADATIAGAGVAPHFKGAAEDRELREQERASLSAAHKAVQRLHEHLGPATLSQVRALGELIPGTVQQGPNAAIFGDLARELHRRQNELEILLSPLVERLAALGASLEQSRVLLAQIHDPQEARYRELMKEADAHASGLSAREEAAREVLRLSGVKAELVALDRAIAEAHSARAALLTSYEALRRERFVQRSEVAAAVSARLGGKVRVIVTADADLSAYREFLAILMKKSGRQYNAPIDKIIAAVAPTELAELADRGDPGALAATADINLEFAESLLQNLREHRERRLELDVLDRQDVPRIELNIGGEWRSAERLSTGQKSSAILPILLLESEAPLFIDQPEDNLDNSFISDAVVPQIREIKRRRQLLMITHNPNLPVLGDAERVIVLEADGRSARVLAQGDVHAAKEHILRLMEGGWDAFRLRQERYERP
jgi:ABC-type lipoprotein export system ATPase subunit